MKYQDVIDTVDAGKTVCWGNIGYEVIKSKESFYVHCEMNGSCVGLQNDFYKADEPDYVDHSKFNDKFFIKN